MDEIARLEGLEGAEINQAKVILANEATSLLHGANSAKQAEATARKTFEEGGTAAGLPTFEADISGMLAIDGAILCGLASSKGEARRHIKGNALKVNDERVTDPMQSLSASDINEGVIKISVGKKRHALIRPV